MVAFCTRKELESVLPPLCVIGVATSKGIPPLVDMNEAQSCIERGRVPSQDVGELELTVLNGSMPASCDSINVTWGRRLVPQKRVGFIPTSSPPLKKASVLASKVGINSMSAPRSLAGSEVKQKRETFELGESAEMLEVLRRTAETNG